ncbi:MAG: hypothetical protein J7M03_04540 [Candidatus Desulfofervidaceae bacterium]|nr:hypothetical protein [Candidatus Desulfofervidaceae bacterium]MDL1970226.1 hypothetical protein [Candidatus Desulfofervidaceae bacterium]
MKSIEGIKFLLASWGNPKEGKQAYQMMVWIISKASIMLSSRFLTGGIIMSVYMIVEVQVKNNEMYSKYVKKFLKSLVSMEGVI